MLLSWYLTDKVYGIPYCFLTEMNHKLCENNGPVIQIPGQYIVITVSIILYDIYMLLRA